MPDLSGFRSVTARKSYGIFKGGLFKATGSAYFAILIYAGNEPYSGQNYCFFAFFHI